MNSVSNQKLAKLQQKLDVEFQNERLLVEALTHCSYLNENRHHPTGHNERLEFLGDAVIELIVTEFLFNQYPNEPEGVLTNHRAILVCGTNLGEIAESLGLSDYMFLSEGQKREHQWNQKAFKYANATVFEAIVGALYLDQGLGMCRLFLDNYLHMVAKSRISSSADYKSVLQNDLQARFKIAPRYVVLTEHGKDHVKVFTMACYVGDVKISEGTGASKKEAQIAAAKLAIETRTTWEDALKALPKNVASAKTSRKR